MPSKPSFSKQETPYSCVPACLRMVFRAFGLSLSEDEIRRTTDCTPLGTDALKAVDAARKYGFVRTAKHTISLEEISALVNEKGYPIVYVSLSPIDGFRDTHSLVVLNITKTAVTVYDPLKGERVLPIQTFSAAWAMRHNLVILVEK